jgi:two-component system response regulator DesR
LCVEDNSLVGDAIGRKIRDDAEFEWMGCVGTADDLYAKLTPAPPDVVCMDLEMPGQDAFAMIRELQHRSPTTRVLILTGHVGSDYVERAIEAGAWGYLTKAEESRIIVEAFRRVASGQFVSGGLTASGRERAMTRENRGAVASGQSLWQRVKRVLFGNGRDRRGSVWTGGGKLGGKGPARPDNTRTRT